MQHWGIKCTLFTFTLHFKRKKDIYISHKMCMTRSLFLNNEHFKIRPSSLPSTWVRGFRGCTLIAERLRAKGSGSGFHTEGRVIPLWAGQPFTHLTSTWLFKRKPSRLTKSHNSEISCYSFSLSDSDCYSLQEHVLSRTSTLYGIILHTRWKHI